MASPAISPKARQFLKKQGLLNRKGKGLDRKTMIPWLVARITPQEEAEHAISVVQLLTAAGATPEVAEDPVLKRRTASLLSIRGPVQQILNGGGHMLMLRKQPMRFVNEETGEGFTQQVPMYFVSKREVDAETYIIGPAKTRTLKSIKNLENQRLLIQPKFPDLAQRIADEYPNLAGLALPARTGDDQPK